LRQLRSVGDALLTSPSGKEPRESEDEDEVNEGGALSPHQLFLQTFRHPSCAALVQELKAFANTFPRHLERAVAVPRIQAYLRSMEERVQRTAVMEDASAELVRAMAEGLERSLLAKISASLVGNEDDAVADGELFRAIDSLSWVEPSHLGLSVVNEAGLEEAIGFVRQVDRFLLFRRHNCSLS
jgi:hypothetical protein